MAIMRSYTICMPASQGLMQGRDELSRNFAKLKRDRHFLVEE
ncbi:13993_t:CDS:2, partial [Funneliformis mosseae]